MTARSRARAHSRRLRIYGLIAWSIAVYVFLVACCYLPTVGPR